LVNIALENNFLIKTKIKFYIFLANPKQKKDPKASKGYVHESDVIAMAKAAGFKLIAKSEINANKKDTKDYPEGVWTLPPSYRLGDKDKTKYAAIGESDRMTLKFQKP
ncbi:MAG TPA: hypothetical protein PLY93_13640, partial [Turneriella sp.]|nr:hypothetical protein [Turneriella sp.]